MKRIYLLLIFLLLCGILPSGAQSFKVSGEVRSAADKEPLMGVTVREKGSAGGVVTDLDGRFSMELKGQKAVLVFAYVGMKTKEVSVGPQSAPLKVELEDLNRQIDEVVVIAYGTRKKGTIAGAVDAVDGQELADVPAASFDQALQGKATGLSVVSSSGEPSRAATFQIRGTNSINSGTSPLFILDGVPVEASTFSALSPADIESVSVLKDASATSIYGARAANGVVVITTKRGRKGKDAQVNVTAQWGFSQLAGDHWNLMNTAERIAFEKEVGLDLGDDFYRKVGGIDVNWLDEVYRRQAPLQSYEVNVSGASERTNYYVSGGFYDQDGIAQGSTFRRYNVRTNVEHQAKDWLRLGTNTMLAYEDIEQAVDGEYTVYAPISAAMFMMPYWDPHRSDGSLASTNDGSWKGSGVNPLEWMDQNPVRHKSYKMVSALFAEITPLKGLTIRSQLGIDYAHATSFMQSFPSYSLNNGSGAVGRASSDDYTLTVTNTVNYSFNIGTRHRINLLAGQEGISSHDESFTVQTDGQTNDALTNLTAGSYASSWSDATSEYGFLSFFGRGEYNYDARYYADFSVRGDASSRFGKDNRWATFWSVGLMWDLRHEAFMQDRAEWLTNAQLTFSTGTSGNSSISNYTHMALVSGNANYMGQTGLVPSSRGNEDLTWEKTWSTNVGLRLGFLERANLSVDFYNKLTTDMLMSVPVSYADKGYGSRWDNVGAMVNRGVEISADGDVVRTKDFRWNLYANVSYNMNKLTELYNGIDEYVDNNITMYAVGKTVSGFYMVRYAGVNPANGDALWYTKDGKITNVFSEDDRVFIEGKSYIAPWQGGFGTTLSWKGLSLTAHFSWMADRWIYNNDRIMTESNGLYTDYNQSNRLLYDRWKKPGDVTDIPRYGVTPQFDTHYLENASFLRLKNLMLAYALPQRWMERTHFFSKARVFAQAQNLLTFTPFTGLDPEVSANIYRAAYPTTRQFTFGVELNF